MSVYSYYRWHQIDDLSVYRIVSAGGVECLRLDYPAPRWESLYRGDRLQILRSPQRFPSIPDTFVVLLGATL